MIKMDKKSTDELNYEELLNTVNAIKTDVALISFCVLFITALVLIELILSMT